MHCGRHGTADDKKEGWCIRRYTKFIENGTALQYIVQITDGGVSDAQNDKNLNGSDAFGYHSFHRQGRHL